MSRFVILSIEDGAYHHAGEVVPKPKQNRTNVLKEWIRANGENGNTYKMAEWLTPGIKAMEKITMELELQPEESTEPAPKPERVVGSME